MKTLRALLTLVGFVFLTGGVGAAPNQSRIPGVIGPDDRQIIDTAEAPWVAIGRINVGGYRRTSHCTGTLIAPRLVVTAAHCLADERTGEPVPVDRIHFLAGARRGDYQAHAEAACIRFHQRYRPSGGSLTPQAAYDVAVIVLASEPAVEPVPLALTLRASEGVRLIHAGYPRDRPYLLSADGTCRLRGRKDGFWLTDCDTSFGDSGGPVLTQSDRGLVLAGIMIGFVPGKFSAVVPLSTWVGMTESDLCH